MNRLFIIILLTVTSIVQSAYAFDEPVAMITSVSGIVLSEGKSIANLTELKSDSSLELLNADSKVTIVLLATAEEFNLQGNAKVTIQAASINDDHGKPLTGNNLLVAASTLTTKNIEQTAVVMRGLKIRH